MLPVLLISVGHVPQFADKFPMEMKHDDVDISQVTYFRRDGSTRYQSMQGLYVAEPKENVIVQVAFPSNDPVGSLYAGCVANRSQTPPEVNLTSAKGTNEPFTQTKYYLKYDATFPDCEGLDYAIYGNFDGQWSAVVGKKESFSATELLSFPIYSAKLHGSWWNENYVYQWPFLAAVLVSACFGLRTLTVALFVASAANRLAHAWTFVVFADLIPAVLVVCDVTLLWWALGILTAISMFVLSSWWLGVVLIFLPLVPVVGKPLLCLFIFGSGYFVAPFFLFLTLAKEYLGKTRNNINARGRNVMWNLGDGLRRNQMVFEKTKRVFRAAV